MAVAASGVPIRPFRFGFNDKAARLGNEWTARVRRLEAIGYSVLQIADHYSVSMPTRFAPGETPDPSFHTFAPTVGLAYAAAVTTTLRLAPHVAANDFRNPGVLAKDIASIDVLSGGRVELGIGAGYLEPDYENLGISFDPPGVRIGRLADALSVIKDLFEHGEHDPMGPYYAVRAVNGPLSHQRPRPPILVGGKGPRMLALAAREADTVGILPQPAERLAAAVDLVVRESAFRPMPPEINVVMMPGDACSATTLGGSVATMADHLRRQRDELGISYVGFTDVTSAPEDWADLVERLAGT